ncbi:hypothetical protein QA597_09510 [Marinilabiliaceae bacterium ANBcel2]|nr:hypothetical protein [Marinilabiliaceae bacterium ANBcel2]
MTKNLLCAIFCTMLLIATPSSNAQKLFDEPLISLWNHRTDLDLTDLVSKNGFNLIWTHDEAYTGVEKFEDTHMYKCLQIEGVDYVLAKIERAQWGWTQEESVRHAKWIAKLSLKHKGIFGLYLNDFYDEIEDGIRTEEQWEEIIAAAKDVNPDIRLVAPHYPHRNQEKHSFDFEIDGIILNLWGNTPEIIDNAEKHLKVGLEHHPDRFVIAGLYLHSGVDGGNWLTKEEFKKVLSHYVEMVNKEKLAGLRIFSAGQLIENPEYIKWTKKVFQNLY